MPLTEQERAEILSRRGGTPKPSAGGFSPYPGLELQDVTVGRNPSARYGKAASPSDSMQQQELTQENFANLLTRLRSGYEKAQTVERGPKALASGVARTGKSMLQLDPEVSTYSGLRKATLGQAARVISTERGVMTNQDMNRIESAIPDQFTARETGNQQFDQLEGITVDTVKTAINRGRRQRGEPEMTDEEVRAHLGLGAGNDLTPEESEIVNRLLQ